MVHKYRGTNHVLEENDNRYILPIPIRELDIGGLGNQANPSNNNVR